MAEIYWLEQTQDDLPATNDWLAAREMSVLSSLVFLKRRTDWRLGRWTAKCAFAHLNRLSVTPSVLAQIEILAAASGAPELFRFSRPELVTVSISHRSQSAICAITAADIKLGCDLEKIEPHTASFVEDYFTPDEQALIAFAPVQDLPLLTTLLWSAKESTLKALKLGLRADTRSVQIELPHTKNDRWAPLRAQAAAGDTFQGWWHEENGMIRTIIGAFAESQPIRLPERNLQYG
jgi:4'-phosphopantetheinyl transferase